jgi:hypothetical protein
MSLGNALKITGRERRIFGKENLIARRLQPFPRRLFLFLMMIIGSINIRQLSEESHVYVLILKQVESDLWLL